MIAALVGMLASPGSAPGQDPPSPQFYGVVSQTTLTSEDLARI